VIHDDKLIPLSSSMPQPCKGYYVFSILSEMTYTQLLYSHYN